MKAAPLHDLLSAMYFLALLRHGDRSGLTLGTPGRAGSQLAEQGPAATWQGAAALLTLPEVPPPHHAVTAALPAGPLPVPPPLLASISGWSVCLIKGLSD